LIADFQNENGWYSNAVLWRYFVATVNHVSRENPLIMTPSGDHGKFSFRQIGNRDLAISENANTQNPYPKKHDKKKRGFHRVYTPSVDDILMFCGHHGPERKYFEFEVKVFGYDTKDRIIIEAVPRMGLRKASLLRRNLVPEDFDNFFQEGMSGSPGLSGDDKVAGLLSTRHPGHFVGHRARLEQARYLK
jgi:hypothetical protein